MREICTCETPIISETSHWVLPIKYLKIIILRSLSLREFIALLRAIISVSF